MLKVLVVDDEKDVAAIVQKVLSHAGFEVKVEHDPIEAYKKFRQRLRLDSLHH